MLLEKWKNSVDKGKCFRSLLIDVSKSINNNNNNNNNDNNNNNK